MIYFDCTKTAQARHASGLVRVSSRLRVELGNACEDVIWNDGWRRRSGETLRPAPHDWLLTPELFSEAERPGFWAFLAQHPCRLAAIFHDAIPLQLPHITWPQSVARHPEYMTMLGRFDRVFAVSRASAADLLGFWKWQGATPATNVETIQLGADASGVARAERPLPCEQPPLFVCVGIVEPRKNQGFVASVVERALGEGLEFSFRFVGRVNPHFGKPVAERLAALSRRYPQVRHDALVSDAELAQIWRQASASVFATRAEGCGLPLLESLWMGVPCLCSALPPLVENAREGGCVPLPVNDEEAWLAAIRQVVREPALRQRLQGEATTRALPAWADTARALRVSLGA